MVLPEYCKTPQNTNRISQNAKRRPLNSMRMKQGLRSRLQSVQNAAARLVSGARRYDCTTPVLQDLHWLLFRRRVDFKMASLVYLLLSGTAPAYLAADCLLVSDKGRHQLCSATSRTCVVRRTYSNYGDRCFAAACLKLWNSSSS